MHFAGIAVVLGAAAAAAPAAAFVTGVDPNHPPAHSESGMYGTNQCGTKDSAGSKCQNLWINSADDFCLFAPPTRQTVGDAERQTVSYCTKAGKGARLAPKGTFGSVHFIRTPHYVQITGTGDFTKINIPKGDEGGELDPHGADGKGNPIGGLVFGNKPGAGPEQFENWTQFISDNEFCIRACHNGPDSYKYCEHIYDVMGCYWNMPANYGRGFDTCDADDTKWPMGLYPAKNGGTSTWHQGVKPTPSAAAAPKSSNCKAIASPSGAAYPKSKALGTTPVAKKSTATQKKPTTPPKKPTTKPKKPTTKPKKPTKKPASKSSGHKSSSKAQSVADDDDDVYDRC